MDQTDVAVNVGFVAGMVPGAIVLQKVTEWPGWIAYPIGAILGIILIAVVVFLLMSAVASIIGRHTNRSVGRSDEDASNR